MIRFYIDPATGVPHVYNHGVDESEVRDVLEGSSEDRPGRDGTRLVIGQTRGGRFLRVIYSLDPEADSVFIITAHELNAKQLTAYRRRRRRKHK